MLVGTHSQFPHYLGDDESNNWFAREREIFWHVGGICSISTAHFRVQGMAPLWGRGRLAQGLWERRPRQVGGRNSIFRFSDTCVHTSYLRCR